MESDMLLAAVMLAARRAGEVYVTKDAQGNTVSRTRRRPSRTELDVRTSSTDPAQVQPAMPRR